MIQESEGSSEYTSGSEEESSEDEMAPRRKLMKPVFVPKYVTVGISGTHSGSSILFCDFP